MRAGPLNKVVDIQQYTTLTDAYGEEVVSYVQLKNTRASIKPITGTETFIDARLLNEVSHSVEIRYDSLLNLNPKDRIVYDTRNFDIINVLNMNEKNVKYIILCKEELK